MPDYKTHQRINSVVLFIVNASALVWYRERIPFDFVVFTLAFILSSWILTPDLDTKSTPYYHWKGARIVWNAFQKMSKHRGILHHPVLSPIILCGPLVLIQLEFNLKWELFGLYAGITAQIWLHILSDWIVSWKKRRKEN